MRYTDTEAMFSEKNIHGLQQTFVVCATLSFILAKVESECTARDIFVEHASQLHSRYRKHEIFTKSINWSYQNVWHTQGLMHAAQGNIVTLFASHWNSFHAVNCYWCLISRRIPCRSVLVDKNLCGLSKVISERYIFYVSHECVHVI